VPIGRLADATSRKRVIMVALLAWSAVTFATGFAKSFFAMFLYRAGVASGEAGVSPSSGAIIADLFPREKFALPISIYTMSIYIGGGLALILGGWILETFKGVEMVAVPLLGEMAPWRFSFVAVALLGVPWLLVLAIFLREPPRHEYTTYQQQDSKNRSIPLKEVARFLFKYRHFFGSHFAGFTLTLVPTSALLAWIPTILIRIFGVPIEEVGRTFGVLYAVLGIAGAFAGGWLSNFLTAKGRKQAPLELAMLAQLGVLASAVALTLITNQTLAIVISGASVFFIAPGISLAVAAYIAVTPNRIRAQMSGLYLMVTGILGIGTGPVIAAIITDYVFVDENMLHYSIAALGVAFFVVYFPILIYARKKMLALDLW
ncbi:MAG: MFS transporter, partial [Gammaproteobacteria bacterium]|nr:MFS transporter [Gammaproteobacteria bacterium]